ncbi:MarR family winged helix-turn-helix transcriptional regulator [Actinomadura madurae]|uniref:MarR family winged helix-turn-helix transcriptional regulator n=2 Tax=Actinomadura madurae TaxID=1993 RepID=UPI002026E9B1|nr:MarR family winged helix-turn-helix transcriptional regulator [Actinomadura madurae]URN03931.1 MarR family winged helix-turn-helix transcriptional regulator [Actinomadura madurae]
MEDRPDPLYDSPTYLMFETVRLVRRTATRMFPGQLRLPHLLVLWCAARHGPLSQREVAERLRMDAGDLVGIVDALEDAGHVRRRRDPEDRRRYALEATEDGRLKLGEALDARVRLNEMLFEPLSPEERHLFRDMLLRILAHHDERFTGALEPPGQQTGTGVPSRSRASS